MGKHDDTRLQGEKLLLVQQELTQMLCSLSRWGYSKGMFIIANYSNINISGHGRITDHTGKMKRFIIDINIHREEDVIRYCSKLLQSIVRGT